MELKEPKRESILNNFLSLNPKDEFKEGEVVVNSLTGIINIFRQITREYNIKPVGMNENIQRYSSYTIENGLIVRSTIVTIPNSENENISLDDYNTRIEGNRIRSLDKDFICVYPLSSVEEASIYVEMLQEIVKDNISETI